MAAEEAEAVAEELVEEVVVEEAAAAAPVRLLRFRPQPRPFLDRRCHSFAS